MEGDDDVAAKNVQIEKGDSAERLIKKFDRLERVYPLTPTTPGEHIEVGKESLEFSPTEDRIKIILTASSVTENVKLAIPREVTRYRGRAGRIELLLTTCDDGFSSVARAEFLVV